MEEQGFEEFRRKIQNTGKKVAKVTGSFGVYDIYKHIRKNHWYDIGRKVTEKEFYAIIRGVNKYLAENISDGITVTFPCHMGKIELRKYEKGVSIVDGKLKNTYPIDWKETLELWYRDEEERKKKTLVRDEQPFVYQAKYVKDDATYENKKFYQFTLNTYIKRTLKDKIKQGKTDTIYGSRNKTH